MPTVHQTDEYMTLLTAVQAERQSKFEKAQVKRVGREVREAWLQEARMEAHRQKHNRLEKLERLRQEKMAKTKEENELWRIFNWETKGEWGKREEEVMSLRYSWNGLRTYRNIVNRVRDLVATLGGDRKNE